MINVILSASSCSLNNNKVGPPVLKKPSACGLTAGEKFHRSDGKQGMKIHCGIVSSLSEGQCALQSQSWMQYLMSLANVVCMIWTINQRLTACLGMQCQNRGGLAEPHPNGIWGKRGENKTKQQWKECLRCWNSFTYFKILETYIDLSRSWCWAGGSKIGIPCCSVRFGLYWVFDNHSVQKPFRTFSSTT